MFQYRDETTESLAGKADAGHTHTVADTSGLQATLDGKAAASHNHDSAYSPIGHNHDASYAAASHTHASTAISDSTATGRSVLGAADGPAARSVIGAGTSSFSGAYADLTGKPTLGGASALEVGAGAGQVAAGDHTHPGGSEAFPVGAVFIAVVSTNPATLLGYGTWAAFGAGRVLVGLNSGDTDFDTVEEVGGAKTVAAAGTNSAPAFTGNAFTSIINHTHPVTDPGHNHTQNSHTHVITSQTATTGSATSYEHGTLDTSSAEAEATEVTGATTAVNNSTTTGITTGNPSGGVASITPTGSVAAPAFTGSATSVVQPYIVCYFWKRTA